MAAPTMKSLEKRIETLETALTSLLEILTFPGRMPLPDAEILEKDLTTLRQGEDTNSEDT